MGALTLNRREIRAFARPASCLATPTVEDRARVRAGIHATFDFAGRGATRRPRLITFNMEP